MTTRPRSRAATLRVGARRQRPLPPLPRRGVGRARARRPQAVRVPHARKRPGRAELGDASSTSAKATAGRSPTSTPRRSPASPRSESQRSSPTRASCATELKVAAAVNNARQFLEVQEEFDGFANYIWQFVGGKPIQNRWRAHEARCPPRRPSRDALSKDLKQRGFKFVGSTIVYAHMQADGHGQRPPRRLLPAQAGGEAAG